MYEGYPQLRPRSSGAVLSPEGDERPTFAVWEEIATGQYRPRAVFQLRRDPAHAKGSARGGTNCNPAAGATLVDLVTCGKRRATAAAVREQTGDFSGGTTLRQAARALEVGYGLELDMDTGPFTDVIKALRSGRGVSLSGSSAATHKTPFRASETFTGNHQWALTDVRDGPGGGPEILVFDPLADNRRHGIARSPMWMPSSVVREFAGLLDLRSRQEKAAGKPPRRLGLGKATYGVTAPVRCGSPAAASPSVVPYKNATLVAGQGGRRMVVKVAVARVRARPTTLSPIVGRKRSGDQFRAFQRINGQRVAGTTVWYGDRDGGRWIHGSLLS